MLNPSLMVVLPGAGGRKRTARAAHHRAPVPGAGTDSPHAAGRVHNAARRYRTTGSETDRTRNPAAVLRHRGQYRHITSSRISPRGSGGAQHHTGHQSSRQESRAHVRHLPPPPNEPRRTSPSDRHRPAPATAGKGHTPTTRNRQPAGRSLQVRARRAGKARTTARRRTAHRTADGRRSADSTQAPSPNTSDQRHRPCTANPPYPDHRNQANPTPSPAAAAPPRRTKTFQPAATAYPGGTTPFRRAPDGTPSAAITGPEPRRRGTVSRSSGSRTPRAGRRRDRRGVPARGRRWSPGCPGRSRCGSGGCRGAR
ncbi:hypothetical protein SAMN05216251_1452 [Actinacidiphila alni]|uniref:Uncharacterized protein n=1 Tax=Actinacidiphila alni TaxID=380248 RepID=A0A1I2N0J5_9ACTN|nr:hypothetical protein SAMN05216251_1452 [Actinacidiphila alni]